MATFLMNESIKPIRIISEQRLKIMGPRFIGKYSFDLCNIPETIDLNFPAIEINRLRNIIAIGGTNLLLSNDNAVHPDLLEPARDIIPAENFYMARVTLNFKYLDFRLLRKRLMVERAISLLGQCTGNYAHFLTETLPRLILIDSYIEFKDWPLLVDNWIHPNIKASIETFSKYNRDILFINRWTGVNLHEIIDITPTAYITPEYRNFIKTKKLPKLAPEDFPFCKKAIEKLRERSMTINLDMDKITSNKLYKKLYLRRNLETCGNLRTIVNIADVEAIIDRYGFFIIDPGLLTIKEQVGIFREAEIVISPVGASLANTIFSKPGCKIIGLAPYYKNANYYFFSNFMAILGHDLYYVLGEQDKNDHNHLMHRKYFIDIDALEKAIKLFCI